DHGRIDDVGDFGRAAELAGVLGQYLVERLNETGVHDLRQPGLARAAPRLGKRACGNDWDDAASDGFAPERPEAAVVALGRDQRARVERQSRQRDLTRASSLSLIGPCSAPHPPSRVRAASSFRRYSTASATNADRLRPAASAASRVRWANSGSKESDNFSTATTRSYHGRIARVGLRNACAFSLLSATIPNKGTPHGRRGRNDPRPSESAAWPDRRR